MTAFLEGLKSLGSARLVALATVGLAMHGFLAVLASQGGGTRMALLCADLDLREAAQMTELLDAQHVVHQSGAGGAEILVPESDVGRARLLLARQGLPSGGSIGYELFDRGDGLTTTQFQQQINQARALEGELARTIRAIAGVRAARVHLVLPRREPFERERQEAQASVMLTLAGAGRLDPEGVQAILNLVAAAVPGLRPKNIAIADSRGDVLARAGETEAGAASAQSFAEVKRATELRLARAVEEMLERSLGQGRVRAEAAVEYDVAQVRETQEKYDPDGKVERSTQSVTDSNRSTEAPPAVSVQNNLPNADAGAKEGAGSQEQRQEETTNFEIGKTVRTLVREQPEIRRISLAVMVDGTRAAAAEGKPEWKPRDADELSRIAALVRSAIGYDEKRGDKVEVVNMRFADEDVPTPPAPRRVLGMALDTPDLIHLAQTGLFGILGLLALMFVLRPMVLRLAGTSSQGNDVLQAAGAAGVSEGGRNTLALPGPDAGRAGTATLPSGATTARLTGPSGAGAIEDESMVDILNLEGQLRASSIRRIASLVDKHPEESLSIVPAWMQQEAA